MGQLYVIMFFIGLSIDLVLTLVPAISPVQVGHDIYIWSLCIGNMFHLLWVLTCLIFLQWAQNGCYRPLYCVEGTAVQRGIYLGIGWKMYYLYKMTWGERTTTTMSSHIAVQARWMLAIDPFVYICLYLYPFLYLGTYIYILLYIIYNTIEDTTLISYNGKILVRLRTGKWRPIPSPNGQANSFANSSKKNDHDIMRAHCIMSYCTIIYQIAKPVWSASPRFWLYPFISTQCLISVNPLVFSSWPTQLHSYCQSCNFHDCCGLRFCVVTLKCLRKFKSPDCPGSDRTTWPLKEQSHSIELTPPLFHISFHINTGLEFLPISIILIIGNLASNNQLRNINYPSARSMCIHKPNFIITVLECVIPKNSAKLSGGAVLPTKKKHFCPRFLSLIGIYYFKYSFADPRFQYYDTLGVRTIRWKLAMKCILSYSISVWSIFWSMVCVIL